MVYYNIMLDVIEITINQDMVHYDVVHRARNWYIITSWYQEMLHHNVDSVRMGYIITLYQEMVYYKVIRCTRKCYSIMSYMVSYHGVHR